MVQIQGKKFLTDHFSPDCQKITLGGGGHHGSIGW